MLKTVVLAGGRGTRLASVISDKPKPMADIAGLPFLHYLIIDLKQKGIDEITLLVGHLHHIILDYFGENYQGVKLSYEIESEPRGTGGLICELSKKWNSPILLINGDTYFDVDIAGMISDAKSEIIMAVREVVNSDRYGVLEIKDNRIIDFKEKTWVERGYINGGIYYLPQGVFDAFNLSHSFSIEKDFFEAHKQNLNLKPFISQGFFIDIGIPMDYQQAQTSIPLQLIPQIDKTWTLFLDRDGVLNKHRPDDYVKNLNEFEWIEGSIKAVVELSKLFGRVLAVTNQQGIGKGIMSEYELEKIHWKLQDDIAEAGGNIDRIYYCPHLAAVHPKCRKPEIGMALQAKEDFAEIDFTKSVMVGDSATDMEFGSRLGMFNVLVANSQSSQKEALKLKSLAEFSQMVLKIREN